MATITGPRQTRPCPVGTLVDVTNSRVHTSLKRSPRRYSKHGETQPTRSLRDSYAEASMKAAKVQQFSIDSLQFAVSKDLKQMMDSQPLIDPNCDQIPPSGSCHPVSENSTITTKDLSGRKILRLTENHSGTVAAPATPVKTLSEKPLPPKPALRFRDTPEKWGIFDTTDLTAMSLNDRFPPLELTSTTEPARSDQLSPASSSPHVTPSLLSRKQSSNSVSTGVIECGIASVTVIQPVISYDRIPDIDHSGDTSSRKYGLNVSRSSRIPRRNSLLNSGQKSYGSPSRQSPLGSKVTRSMLHGRQAVSAHPESRDAPQRGKASSVPSSTALGAEITLEQTRNKDVLEHFTDEGTLRTSSKYGYSIRESFEAREAIMGHSKPRNQVNSLLNSRSNFATTNRSAPARELNLELATPDAKSESEKDNKQDVTAYLHFSGSDKASQEIDQVVDGQKAKPSTPLRTGYRAFGQRPTPHKGQYPPRTSSLPSTPSSQQTSSSGSKININLGSDRHKLPVPKTQLEVISSSEFGKAIPPNSRLSFFYRPTTASAARASFNAKKVNEPRHSISRIPQSRTLASLYDVGKGVKSLGKKVSKIIPGRRNIEVEAVADEVLTVNGDHMSGPRRQASRLLTTYKNSGMNDKLCEEIRHFIPTGDTFIEPEPVDHHETEGTDKQKWIWQKGSHNVAYDAEAGRFMPFDQGAGDDYDEDEDEDRPPHRRGVLSAPAHYIDIDDDEEPEDDGDATVENDELDASNFADQEDDIGGQLPPPHSSSIGGTGAAADGVNQPTASNAENRFDSLIAETDTRIRQLLTYAMSLQQSRHRNLLIESATHLGEGVMHIRQARIETVRVTQLLEETAVLLNTHLLSLAMQQSSVIGHAP